MGKTYWVIGGEFSSLNFHSFVEGTQIILGPYNNLDAAQEAWKKVSEENRHKANYRFLITSE